MIYGKRRTWDSGRSAPDVNPFDLDDDNPAATLRLTHRGMKDFIWAPGTQSGQRLGQIWQQCLIRRTLTSTIPFDGIRMIGADIPPASHTIVIAPFTPAELKLYESRTTGLYRRLGTRLRDGRVIWNTAKYRQLSLLTTWLPYSRQRCSSYSPPSQILQALSQMV